jgi:hypothetical protein
MYNFFLFGWLLFFSEWWWTQKFYLGNHIARIANRSLQLWNTICLCGRRCGADGASDGICVFASISQFEHYIHVWSKLMNLLVLMFDIQNYSWKFDIQELNTIQYVECKVCSKFYKSFRAKKIEIKIKFRFFIICTVDVIIHCKIAKFCEILLSVGPHSVQSFWSREQHNGRIMGTKLFYSLIPF